MRRTPVVKVADKSAEKKKRDALIQSIASEETVKARLVAEVAEKKAELHEYEKTVTKAKEQAEYWTKAGVDAERVFKDLESKVKPLHSEIGELTKKCADLIKEEITIRQNVAVAQEMASAELARISNLGVAEQARVENELNALDRECEILGARVDILMKTENTLLSTIENKTRELASLDASLELRVKELSSLNSNIIKKREETDMAYRELKDIDARIQSLRSELLAKDKEVNDKVAEIKKAEDEVLAYREKLIGLAGKEKRLQELIPAIENLYSKAGLKIKI